MTVVCIPRGVTVHKQFLAESQVETPVAQKSKTVPGAFGRRFRPGYPRICTFECSRAARSPNVGT